MTPLLLLAVGVFAAGFATAWRPRRCPACAQRADIDRILAGWGEGERAPHALPAAPAPNPLPTYPVLDAADLAVVPTVDNPVDSGPRHGWVPAEPLRPTRYRGRRRRTWWQALTDWWATTAPADPDDPIDRALAWTQPVDGPVLLSPRGRFTTAAAPDSAALRTLAADWRAALLDAAPVARELFGQPIPAGAAS